MVEAVWFPEVEEENLLILMTEMFCTEQTTLSIGGGSLNSSRTSVTTEKAAIDHLMVGKKILLHTNQEDSANQNAARGSIR